MQGSVPSQNGSILLLASLASACLHVAVMVWACGDTARSISDTAADMCSASASTLAAPATA